MRNTLLLLALLAAWITPLLVAIALIFAAPGPVD